MIIFNIIFPVFLGLICTSAPIFMKNKLTFYNVAIFFMMGAIGGLLIETDHSALAVLFVYIMSALNQIKKAVYTFIEDSENMMQIQDAKIET